LPEGAPPLPSDPATMDDFSPFKNRAAFELADLIFRRDQMSANDINNLLHIWAATLPQDQDPPFVNKQELYKMIDSISHGDAPWHLFSIIHLDTILHSAHPMGVAGNAFIPCHLTYQNSLDAFQKFYVNKYIDHHAHEIAF